MRIPTPYIIIAILIMILSIFCIDRFFFGKKDKETETIVTHDTISVHSVDTLVNSQPIYTTIVKHDTFLIERQQLIHDTIDTTIAVVLPRESKTYLSTIEKDTIITIVSGISPTLDSIILHRNTNTIINTTINTSIKKKNKTPFSIGVQIGIGMNTKQITPYLGVGVNYELIHF